LGAIVVLYKKSKKTQLKRASTALLAVDVCINISFLIPHAECLACGNIKRVALKHKGRT